MTVTRDTLASPLARVSRREFLYYLWGASAAALTIGGCRLTDLWAFQTYPELRKPYSVSLNSIPPKGSPPQWQCDSSGQPSVWFSHIDAGLLALNETCPYKGCIVGWVKPNSRFECPCCGSKFTHDGTYIEGPAPRGLRCYVLQVKTAHEWRESSPSEKAVSVDDAIEVYIDLTRLILGKLRP